MSDGATPRTGRAARTARRDPLWIVAAIACVVLAVVAPTDELLPRPSEPHPVLNAWGPPALGVWVFRIALIALAGVLVVLRRVPEGEEPRERATGLGTAALLAMVALAIRLVKLDAPMWLDEIWMVVDFARLPADTLLTTFGSDNNHLLYTLLAKVSVSVFGEAAWSLRLPAAVFGAAGVGALYAFAHRWIGPRIALASAAALAVAGPHVSYSQNARAYTGLLFLTLLSSHLLLVLLRSPRRGTIVAYGAALALCVHLHLTGAFLAAGHVVVIAVAACHGGARWRSALAGLVTAVVMGLVLYALVLPQMIHFFVLREPVLTTETEWNNPWWMVTEGLAGVGLPAWTAVPLLVAGVVFAAAGLRRCGRNERLVPYLIVPPALLLGGAMIAMGRNLWPRLFFFEAGFAVLVAVAGGFEIIERLLRLVDREHWSRRVTGAAGVLVVLAAAATLPVAWALPKQDYEAAQRYVEEHRGPQEPVLTIGNAAFCYERYYEAGFVNVASVDDVERHVPKGSGAFVVTTLPVFDESRFPELMGYLRENASEAARFRAAIGGADVVVRRVER